MECGLLGLCQTRRDFGGSRSQISSSYSVVTRFMVCAGCPVLRRTRSLLGRGFTEVQPPYPGLTRKSTVATNNITFYHEYVNIYAHLPSLDNSVVSSKEPVCDFALGGLRHHRVISTKAPMLSYFGFQRICT